MVKSQKDFWSGVLFIVVGLAFVIGAQNYSLGDSGRMGPGYFPSMLGFILAGLGVIVLLTALRGQPKPEDQIGSFAWRPLIFVIAGNLAFGLCLGGLKIGGQTLIPVLGLIVGIYALIVIASYASPKFKLRTALINATVLSVGSYLVFIKLLSLVIPVWPAFITG